MGQLDLQNELLTDFIESRGGRRKWDEAASRAEADRGRSGGGGDGAGDATTSGGAGVRKAADSSASDGVLTEEQLKDIAVDRIAAATTDRDRRVEAWEAELEALGAQADGAELRAAEIRRRAYEFRRDVVVGGEDLRTGRVPAALVARFLDDVGAHQESSLRKLELRNRMARQQAARLEAAVRQREEKGETPTTIDFDQLRIENRQHLERIDERNAELAALKLTTGRTVQRMNALKERLAEVLTHHAFLETEIAQRAKGRERVEADILKVEATVAVLERQLAALQAEREDPEAPQVMDYLKVKARATELGKELQDLRRKEELADLEADGLRARLRRAAHSVREAAGGSGLTPQGRGGMGSRGVSRGSVGSAGRA